MSNKCGSGHRNLQVCVLLLISLFLLLFLPLLLLLILLLILFWSCIIYDSLVHYYIIRNLEFKIFFHRQTNQPTKKGRYKSFSKSLKCFGVSEKSYHHCEDLVSTLPSTPIDNANWRATIAGKKSIRLCFKTSPIEGVVEKE